MSTDTGLKPISPLHATPMQALSSLFRTPTRLRTPTAVSRRNKRTRARASSLSSTPSTPSTPSLPAVVLQTYSVSTDSIILTALPSAPFCCHEDLLTMSRTQLEGVVRALNTRLPRRLRIGPEDNFWQDDNREHTGEWDEDEDDGLSRMSEAEMKRRIEELVGIRAVVGKNRVSKSGLGLDTRAGIPQAPKAVRTREATWRLYEQAPWEMEVDDADDVTDDLNSMIEAAMMGSSPLAGRTKTVSRLRRRNSTLSLLPILQEENEGESKEGDSEDHGQRPSKRQRVAFGYTTPHAEDSPQISEDVGKSRLIENIDISGSSWLVGDDHALDDFAIPSNEAATTTSDSAANTKTSEGPQSPLQRRRSTRIRGITLKRASSTDTAKKSILGIQGPKPSILRAKTFSSRRSSRDKSTPAVESNATKDPNIPREFAIRLPFASTPPDTKSDSSTWSGPRILRSHSQRLKSTKKTNPLERSRSERYPRASDLAFVTINRPRYRFTRREPKAAKEDEETCLSPDTPLVHATGQQGPNYKYEDEKENEDPNGVSKHSVDGLEIDSSTLASSLCNVLSSRSRAPSTSTVGSTLSNGGDSPTRAMARKDNAPTTIPTPAMRDGATERVLEALGRMVVDSL